VQTTTQSINMLHLLTYFYLNGVEITTNAGNDVSSSLTLSEKMRLRAACPPLKHVL